MLISSTDMNFLLKYCDSNLLHKILLLLFYLHISFFNLHSSFLSYYFSFYDELIPPSDEDHQQLPQPAQHTSEHQNWQASPGLQPFLSQPLIPDELHRMQVLSQFLDEVPLPVYILTQLLQLIRKLTAMILLEPLACHLSQFQWF